MLQFHAKKYLFFYGGIDKAAFSVSERETVSADNMLRLRDEMPEEYKKLLAAGIITTSVTRTFSVRSKKKKARTQRRK